MFLVIDISRTSQLGFSFLEVQTEVRNYNTVSYRILALHGIVCGFPVGGGYSTKLQ